MSDIKLLQDKMKGLQQRKSTLEGQKDLLLKAQGLSEQIEQARFELVDLETEVETAKADREKLKADRNEILSGLLGQIAEKITSLLPEGKAIVRLDENDFFLGWEIYGNQKRYNALSDGEKSSFNPALCHALGANLLIIEAAEADSNKLKGMLSQLLKFDGQVIVCTWFDAKDIPDGWNVVRL